MDIEKQDIPSINRRLEKAGRILRTRMAWRMFASIVPLWAWLILMAQLLGWVRPWRESEAFWLFVVFTGASLIWIIRHWFTKVIPDTRFLSLAKMIERKHPDFMDSFIAAAEVERIPVEKRRVLEHALVETTVEKTASMDFLRDLLDPTLKKWRLIFGSCVAIVALCLVSLLPISLKAFFSALTRLGMIEAGLVVAPGDVDAPEHGDVNVSVAIKRWGGDAVIHYQDPSGRHRFKMNRVGKEFLFTLYDLTTPIKYRITTPALISPWYDVKVFLPPQYKSLEYIVAPPAYTGLPSKRFERLEDRSIIEGSSVKFDLTLDKSFSATLDVSGVASCFKPEESSRRAAIFAMKSDCEVSIALKDTANHESRLGPFSWECVKDTPPVATLIKPGKDVVVKKDGTLQFEGRGGDDFGVAKVQLVYGVSGAPKQTVTLYDDSDNKRHSIDTPVQTTLSMKKLKVENGNVITGYLAVTDNRTPNPQTARSEIFFVEVRPEIKTKKSQGSGAQKELALLAVIAELKRTIRLSYDFDSVSSEDQKVLRKQLRPAIADVLNTATKEMEKIASGAAPGSPEMILHAMFAQAVDSIKKAETLIDRDAVAPSIPFQENALGRLTAIVQILMRNQQSGEGEGKKSQASESGDKNKQGGDKGQKGASMKEQLAQLKKLLSDVRKLGDRQGKINQSVRRLIDAMGSSAETRNLSSKQESLKSETKTLLDGIPDSPITQIFRPDISEAVKAMGASSSQLTAGRKTHALRSGVQSRGNLMAAAEKLDELINRFIAEKLRDLSERAQKSAQNLEKQAQSSMAAGKKGKIPPKELEELRGQQKSEEQTLKDLMYESERFAMDIEKDHPEVAKALNQTLMEASRNNLEGQLKRAMNAMLYKRLNKAASYQKKAAGMVSRMAQGIQSASAGLPKFSREDLLKSLMDIQNAVRDLKNTEKMSKNEAEKSLREIGDKTGQSLQKLGEKMNNAGLSGMGGALKNAPQKGSAVVSRQEMLKALVTAAGIIQRELIAMEIDEKLYLNKKMTAPPEKYRRLVEEYFKSLSEE